jgi:hypothetical protein
MQMEVSGRRRDCCQQHGKTKKTNHQNYIE